MPKPVTLPPEIAELVERLERRAHTLREKLTVRVRPVSATDAALHLLSHPEVIEAVKAACPDPDAAAREVLHEALERERERARECLDCHDQACAELEAADEELRTEQNERGSLEDRKVELRQRRERLEQGPDPEHHDTRLDWADEVVDLEQEEKQALEEEGQRRIAQEQDTVRRQRERRGEG